MQAVQEAIKSSCHKLYSTDLEPVLTRPNAPFGDYSSNVALQISVQIKAKPAEVAKRLAQELSSQFPDLFNRVEAAEPGFINMWLQDNKLFDASLEATHLPKPLKGKEILVEFGDPNPLKEMHLGHLYTTVVGDSIVRLLEATGATVKRLSYQGDVGLHVAKAIWGIGESINWDPSRLGELERGKIRIGNTKLTLETVVGSLYAKGAAAYEENPAAKEKINKINLSVYKKDDPTVEAIYKWGVERSFADFDLIFRELGVIYDKRYLESETADIGIEFVKKHIGSVFERSDGAIVYRGEKAGLHTRVFLTSEGIPTYEAKDLGLAELKNRDYPESEESIVITAHEQAEYFKVMLAALKEIDPRLAEKTTHLPHGFVSLTTGKMSSRKGNILTARALMLATEKAVSEAYPESDVVKDVYLAALKYSFLKHRLGGDMVFDLEESISLDGNSGPYLQYANARANNILKKISAPKGSNNLEALEPQERLLALKVSEYPEAIIKASTELKPHHLAGYLHELAQVFNSFYESNRVAGDPRENIRAQLVKAYAAVIKQGLNTLGLPAPTRM